MQLGLYERFIIDRVNFRQQRTKMERLINCWNDAAVLFAKGVAYIGYSTAESVHNIVVKSAGRGKARLTYAEAMQLQSSVHSRP